MKVKLDENLPAVLARELGELGHDVDTVMDEQLNGHPDSDIWRAAQEEQRFLITQDLDFSDIRVFEPGTHSGILLLRLSRPGLIALFERARQLFASEYAASWAGCFFVATELKLRIHRPKTDD